MVKDNKNTDTISEDDTNLERFEVNETPENTQQTKVDDLEQPHQAQIGERPIKPSRGTRFRAFLKTKNGRALAVLFVVVAVLVVLFAVPFTRYAMLSPFVKKEVAFTIIDAETKRPVTDATVQLGALSVQTDKDGLARFAAAPVGEPSLTVTKQYYEGYDNSYTVPVVFNPEVRTVELKATGRQVSVLINHKVTNKPVANITISSEGTKAISDSDGIATIILPPAKDTWLAEVSGDGFNTAPLELKYNPGETATTSVTPKGSILYLSKATGNLNVMKSNLDGTDAKVLVEGTGQENIYDTTLLSSRDWKYSALLATRNDNKPRVYLIDNEKGDFTVMDEGDDADFGFVGWSGHTFVYTVTRNKAPFYENNRSSLKTFNAENRTLARVDQTSGEGNQYTYTYEYYGSIYIMSDELVFIKGVNSTMATNPTDTLVTINPSTKAKKVVKTFPMSSTAAKLYEPQGLYIRFQPSLDASPTFYEYEDKEIKTVEDTTDNKFFGEYPTFLISPSGDKTLWYQVRDGKNALFVGDKEGKNAKTIATLSEYTPYGWYGDNDQYILLSKGGSELYIAPADSEIQTPVKVTDYHKTRTYPGYGYGYGGQ